MILGMLLTVYTIFWLPSSTDGANRLFVFEFSNVAAEYDAGRFIHQCYKLSK